MTTTPKSRILLDKAPLTVADLRQQLAALKVPDDATVKLLGLHGMHVSFDKITNTVSLW